MPWRHWHPYPAQEGALYTFRYETWGCLLPIYNSHLDDVFAIDNPRLCRVNDQYFRWHWLVSSLASGVTIVLYDGSPLRPLVDGSGDLAMSRLIEELRYAPMTITILTTRFLLTIK